MFATAIFSPCLLFTAFLLFARGLWGWAVGAFGVGMLIAFMFPAGIIVPCVDTDHEAAIRRTPFLRWARRVATVGLWLWLLHQPEFMSLLERISEESALWDRWIIVPFGIITATIIYDRVSR